MNKIDAFVLAGEGEKMAHYTPLLEKGGVTNKALIPLAGKPMVHYILKALNDAETISSITVVGLTSSELKFEFSKPVEYIKGGATTFESITGVVRHIAKNTDESKYILSCSCDTPLITSEMIDKYVSSLDLSKNVDYYFPIVWKNVLKSRYPVVTKMLLKFTNGHFYGGDLHLFKLSTILHREQVLKDILDNRKNFFKIAKIFSFKLIFRFLLNRLNIGLAQDRFKTILDLNLSVSIFDFPDICVDLDYEKDVDEFDRLCALPPRKLGADEGVTFIHKYLD
jgi:molybdopterin-guanine dinucleotide biosynthesis protein A